MQTCLVGITIATPAFAENQSKQQMCLCHSTHLV